MLEHMIRTFWAAANEYRLARLSSDDETARLALEELEAIAMHSESPLLRRSARQLIQTAVKDMSAPPRVRRAALDALASSLA